MMDQSVLDRAVKIATKAALENTPVERIIWLPSATKSADSNGSFVVHYYQSQSACDTPPWEG